MKVNLKRGTLIAALLAAAAAAGCAQDIGDIDRTEPNRVKKSDLEKGSWWMHQKVVDVPGSSSLNAFEGLMMDTEKVVFVAEENYLMAYRSYPTLAGADNQLLNTDGSVDNYEELYGNDYHSHVLAMYPIKSHFDVQRSYDTTTGEQSNVIVENMSDRPWYEREYMRVSWDENPIINFEWILVYGMDEDYELAGYQSVDVRDPLNAPYFEYDDDGQLVYFDAPSTYVFQGSVWDWIYSYVGIYYADLRGASEVRIVTSFAKDLGDADSVNNYEPLDYPNQDMNRFGYFRTERWTYDNHYGFMNSGRIELANRHNIWQAAYDANGNAIPVEYRAIRTIPYYIKSQLNEPLLADMNEQVIDEWNIAFKRAVYIMQHPDNPTLSDYATGQSVNLLTTFDYDTLARVLGSSWRTKKYGAATGVATYPMGVVDAKGNSLANSSMPDVYVPCHIPVAKGDDPVCGEEGYVPREGDFRKNFLWLVNQRQDVGLLGYCPSATDPLTGRTISAQAHVYTAPLNEIAQMLVDRIKFAKGELDTGGVRANDAAVARARESRDKYIELAKLSDKVRSAQLNSPKAKAAKSAKQAKRSLVVKNLKKFDYTSADNVLKTAIAAGVLGSEMSDAAINSFVKRTGVSSASELPDNAIEAASLFNQLSFVNRSTIREMKKALGAKGYCFKNEAATYDLTYSYIIDKYSDRNDYDNIFNEIRAEVFRSTALHEMGHGFGLRHNHTGSFDSMNYFNKYWELRGKDPKTGKIIAGVDDNFWQDKIDSVGDMYKLYDYSDAQLKGNMLGNQYTSIMDYSANYVVDNQGLGKYDHAAILYAYSGGTTNKGGTAANQVGKGLVEIFTGSNGTTPATRNDLGWFAYDVLKHKDTTKTTSTFDDQTTIGQPYLELVHYRDFFSSMKNYDFINNRKVVRMDDYLANSTDDKIASQTAWVRVPYLFCTDDNRGSLRSCNIFDYGADYYEQANYEIRNYRINYWFRDFARGRAFWDAYGASRVYYNTFFTLSDFAQNDYVSDWSTLRDISTSAGLTLNDDVNAAASAASFNFIADVIATPEYGLYCRRTDNGALFNLSTDGEASSEVNEFSQRSRCGRDPEFFYVRQGEGRRRYQKYDVDAGFDYSLYELEIQHNYTSLWAIMALFDNEANVIVDSGDMGTYTLGMYTMYREEAIKLANGVIAENYSIHSPVLRYENADGSIETMTYNGEEVVSGELVYPALAVNTYYDSEDNVVEYDPLTGQSVADFNAMVADVPMYGVCSSDSDCVVGSASGAYCLALMEDQSDKRCVPYWESSDDISCPDGSIAYDWGVFICIPSNLLSSSAGSDTIFATAEKSSCSAKHTSGACEDGKVCRNGTCQAKIAARVESDSSLTQKYYLPAYGMLYTGPIETDSTFYDQFNIYRLGSGQTNTPAEGFKTVKFENPITGEVYVANDRIDESNVSDVKQNGSAMLLKKAQAIADKLDPLWDQVIYWNNRIPEGVEGSEAEENFIDYYYQWYRAKYDLEDAVRDINTVRSMYDVFGTMF